MDQPSPFFVAGLSDLHQFFAEAEAGAPMALADALAEFSGMDRHADPEPGAYGVVADDALSTAEPASVSGGDHPDDDDAAGIAMLRHLPPPIEVQANPYPVLPDDESEHEEAGGDVEGDENGGGDEAGNAEEEAGADEQGDGDEADGSDEQGGDTEEHTEGEDGSGGDGSGGDAQRSSTDQPAPDPAVRQLDFGPDTHSPVKSVSASHSSSPFDSFHWGGSASSGAGGLHFGSGGFGLPLGGAVVAGAAAGLVHVTVSLSHTEDQPDAGDSPTGNAPPITETHPPPPFDPLLPIDPALGGGDDGAPDDWAVPTHPATPATPATSPEDHPFWGLVPPELIPAAERLVNADEAITELEETIRAGTRDIAQLQNAIASTRADIERVIVNIGRIEYKIGVEQDIVEAAGDALARGAGSAGALQHIIADARGTIDDYRAAITEALERNTVRRSVIDQWEGFIRREEAQIAAAKETLAEQLRIRAEALAELGQWRSPDISLSAHDDDLPASGGAHDDDAGGSSGSGYSAGPHPVFLAVIGLPAAQGNGAGDSDGQMPAIRLSVRELHAGEGLTGLTLESNLLRASIQDFLANEASSQTGEPGIVQHEPAAFTAGAAQFIALVGVAENASMA